MAACDSRVSSTGSETGGSSFGQSLPTTWLPVGCGMLVKLSPISIGAEFPLGSAFLPQLVDLFQDTNGHCAFARIHDSLTEWRAQSIFNVFLYPLWVFSKITNPNVLIHLQCTRSTVSIMVSPLNFLFITHPSSNIWIQPGTSVTRKHERAVCSFDRCTCGKQGYIAPACKTTSLLPIDRGIGLETLSMALPFFTIYGELPWLCHLFCPI